jgi:plastocyanin
MIKLYLSVILATVLLSNMTVISSFAQSTNNSMPPTTHSSVDSSPIATIITINEDAKGSISFSPSNVTVNSGNEILFLNNASKPYSVINGEGSNDPLTGKLFKTEIIKSKGFTEYVTSNLQPGEYSFSVSENPQSKGKIIVN